MHISQLCILPPRTRRPGGPLFSNERIKKRFGLSLSAACSVQPEPEDPYYARKRADSFLLHKYSSWGLRRQLSSQSPFRATYRTSTPSVTEDQSPRRLLRANTTFYGGESRPSSRIRKGSNVSRTRDRSWLALAGSLDCSAGGMIISVRPISASRGVGGGKLPGDSYYVGMARAGGGGRRRSWMKRHVYANNNE